MCFFYLQEGWWIIMGEQEGRGRFSKLLIGGVRLEQFEGGAHVRILVENIPKNVLKFSTECEQ